MGPEGSYDPIEAASDPLGRRRRSPCETPTPRERDRQFESSSLQRRESSVNRTSPFIRRPAVDRLSAREKVRDLGGRDILERGLFIPNRKWQGALAVDGRRPGPSFGR